MSIESKKATLKAFTYIFMILTFVAAVIVLYALSPFHPKNISDKTILKKGTEFTVDIRGVSDYNSDGFEPVIAGFFFGSNKAYVFEDENGFAFTTYEREGESYVLGKYNSRIIDYENYSFCGERFKSREELEEFFEEPELIYNFDINKIGEYVQDVLAYKRHFSGKATLKIYKGRVVFADFYIGEEKVLEHKK